MTDDRVTDAELADLQTAIRQTLGAHFVILNRSRAIAFQKILTELEQQRNHATDEGRDRGGHGRP